MYETYLDLISRLMHEVKEKQGKVISDVARMVGDTIMSGHLVYTFGSGHSQLLAQEIRSRAGGLFPIAQVTDPLWGKAEKIEGVGQVLVQYIPFKPGDMIIVISNSGRNPEPIEVALHAKNLGMRVVVMTSMQHTRAVTSRHSSGKKLYELGDVVLDNMVPEGDASMTYENYPFKAGALSTVMGAAILNAVVVEAIQYMLDKNYEPPVLVSANLDGSEAHNAKVYERYIHHPILLFGML